MKDFQIVIPTHARTGRQITYTSLPPELRAEVLLVASNEHEVALLQDNYGLRKSQVLWAPVDSIAAKRHWIMENVKANHIFMMDDDMYFFVRCSVADREYVDGQWKPDEGVKLLPKATPADILNGFAKIEELAPRYAATGLSSRMGNDRVAMEWKENTRLMHAFGINRDIYFRLGLDFREVPIREDMNVALHLLRRGYPNGVLYSMMCSPGPYGAPGGASTERTLDASNAMAAKLAATHPGYVKVVDKDYKGHPRKEVVVYWQRAAKVGGAM